MLNETHWDWFRDRDGYRYHVNTTLDKIRDLSDFKNDKHKDLVVFDIGCSDGLITSKIHDVGFKKVVGFDCDGHAVDVATGLSPHVSFIHKNLFDIDDTCDIAVLSEVIEHSDRSLDDIVKKIHSIVNIGAVITTPLYMGGKINPQHVKEYTVSDLCIFSDYFENRDYFVSGVNNVIYIVVSGKIDKSHSQPFHQLSAEHTRQWYISWYRTHNGDPWRFESSPVDAFRKSEILGIVPKGEYKSALDVGCGEGFITRSMKDVLGVKKVVGADWFDDPVNAARAKDGDSEYIFLDIIKDVLPDTYDVVFACGILNVFNENIIQVIKNLRSMSSKYLVIWDRYTMENRADQLFIKLICENGFRLVKENQYEPGKCCQTNHPAVVALFEVV